MRGNFLHSSSVISLCPDLNADFNNVKSWSGPCPRVIAANVQAFFGRGMNGDLGLGPWTGGHEASRFFRGFATLRTWTSHNREDSPTLHEDTDRCGGGGHRRRCMGAGPPTTVAILLFALPPQRGVTLFLAVAQSASPTRQVAKAAPAASFCALLRAPQAKCPSAQRRGDEPAEAPSKLCRRKPQRRASRTREAVENRPVRFFQLPKEQ